MPPKTMMTLACRCLRRLLEVKDTCLRRVNKNRMSRIGKKARKNPLTCVTVHDVIKRKHTLQCMHGQKASQYVCEGLLQYDLVCRMVVARKEEEPYTRSRANIWCSVYLYTTCGRMHTITCKYHEAERLRAFCRFNAHRV